MFKQLFDEVSSTLTYLLVDDVTKEAVMIDPVARHLDAYLQLTKALGIQLKYALEKKPFSAFVSAFKQ